MLAAPRGLPLKPPETIDVALGLLRGTLDPLVLLTKLYLTLSPRAPSIQVRLHLMLLKKTPLEALDELLGRRL